MENTHVETRPQSRLRTLYYWMLLLVILVMVDDLVFGWFFWGLSQIHPLLSFVIAIMASWSLGVWLTMRGLAPEPGRLAGWFLYRLQLERGNPELRAREDELKEKITSVGVAVPMSLLFGGVVTTLWLRRRGVVSDESAKRLAFVLCGLYAFEFATIHAFGIGGSIFAFAIFR